MCPGCRARGVGCRWVRSLLVLTCHECQSQFVFLSKARSMGRDVWIRILLIRHFNQEGRIMLVKVEGSVQSYVERRGKEGKVFRSVDVYVKGKEPGTLRLNIPEEHHNLIEVCKQSEGKRGIAAVEIRKFEQTGRVFFDLTGLEILK